MVCQIGQSAEAALVFFTYFLLCLAGFVTPVLASINKLLIMLINSSLDIVSACNLFNVRLVNIANILLIINPFTPAALVASP